MRRLIVDGMRKAEDLRDRKRVERIGRILAHAITFEADAKFDKAEEMMRVARDLSDEDVLALRHIFECQFIAQQKVGFIGTENRMFHPKTHRGRWTLTN